jgi:uncharacterized protein
LFQIHFILEKFVYRGSWKDGGQRGARRPTPRFPARSTGKARDPSNSTAMPGSGTMLEEMRWKPNVANGSRVARRFFTITFFFLHSMQLHMPMRIKITHATNSVYAELDKSHFSKTIWDILPLSGKVTVWGGEIRMRTSIHLDEKDPKDMVSMGDVAFWPIDNSVCIYFGATPISVSDDVIRPAMPVCVFGKIKENPKLLKDIKEGDKIKIERA